VIPRYPRRLKNLRRLRRPRCNSLQRRAMAFFSSASRDVPVMYTFPRFPALVLSYPFTGRARTPSRSYFSLVPGLHTSQRCRHPTLFTQVRGRGVLRSSQLGAEHHANRSPCNSEAHHNSNHEPHQKGDYHAIVLVQYLSPEHLAPLCTQVRGRRIYRSSDAASCIVLAHRASIIGPPPVRRIQVHTTCCGVG
jgi:hypothetical protein